MPDVIHVSLESPLINIPHRLNDYIFNVSDNGLFMMVRPHAEDEDVVVTLNGGKVLMILREHESHLIDNDLGNRYRIVARICSRFHGRRSRSSYCSRFTREAKPTHFLKDNLQMALGTFWRAANYSTPKPILQKRGYVCCNLESV
jgi:hypothetical protein